LRKSVLFLLFLIVPIYFLAAQEDGGGEKNRIRVLKSRQNFFSIIESTQSVNSKSFYLDVSKNSRGFIIELSKATADFSLEISAIDKSGEVVGEPKVVATAEWNEALQWNFFETPLVADQRYFVKVSLPKDFILAPSEENPSFHIVSTLVGKSSPAYLTNGKRATFKLNKSNLNLKEYRVQVKSSEIPLLLAYNTIEGSADILLNYGKSAYSSDTANYSFIASTETQDFVLDKSSEIPLKKGVWYITVLSSGAFESVEGMLQGSFLTQGVVKLQPLKALPQERGNNIEACMASAVAVTTPYHSGVGVFVSESGHILTSYGLISDPSGRIARDISLAVSISLDSKPIYLFKAKVIQSDRSRDLALLQISSAAYNKPLPSGFKFPFAKIGTKLDIQTGQPLSVIGFPLAKRRGTFGSVTLLRGVVSGFEKSGKVRYLKSDTLFGIDSSGGIAINVYSELVGVPSPLKSPGAGVLSFLVPVSQIPSGWLSLIGQ